MWISFKYTIKRKIKFYGVAIILALQGRRLQPKTDAFQAPFLRVFVAII